MDSSSLCIIPTRGDLRRRAGEDREARQEVLTVLAAAGRVQAWERRASRETSMDISQLVSEPVGPRDHLLPEAGLYTQLPTHCVSQGTPQRVSLEGGLEAKATTEISTPAWILNGESHSEARPRALESTPVTPRSL